jgi:hypothetical protein
MKLSEISFPVFRLTNKKPVEVDGVLCYITESFNMDTAEFSSRVSIIDDKTLPYDSLSRRRLALKGIPSVNLYPLRRAVYFISDLIKLTKTGYWWIDSSGNIFEYKKSKVGKLTFHKIEKVIPIPGMGAIIDVENIPSRFKVLFQPSDDIQYAGILSDGIGTKFIYGLYSEKPEDTIRKY